MRGGGSRFLQTDPVPGGNANAYDYASQDPTNRQDLSGCVDCERLWSDIEALYHHIFRQLEKYRENPLKIPPTGPGPGGRTRAGERRKIQQNVNRLNDLIRQYNLHCLDLKFEAPLKYAQDPEYTNGTDKLIKRWNPGGAGKEFSGYRDPVGDCGPGGEM